MSDTSEKRVVQEVLCEHFGFVPSAFSRRAVDLGNEVIYQAMDSIEKVVKAKLGTSEQVDKGLLRLETLLESLVDLRFDQYEAYLHRNVFTISPSLIPYLKLDHHPAAGLPDSLRGTDEDLLRQLEEQRRLYEEELEKKHAIDLADERIQRRLEALSALDSELSELGFSSDQIIEDTLNKLSKISIALPELEKNSTRLKEMDLPSLLLGQNGTSRDLSRLTDREAYLNKAVAAKLKLARQETADLAASLVDHSTDGQSGQKVSDQTLETIEKLIHATGSQQDGQSLLDNLGRQAQPQAQN